MYIDYKGHEHDRPGTDYLDDTGKYARPKLDSNAHAHPWRAISKTVPVKKRKTVIDKMERTSGRIGPFTDPAYVAVCEDNLLDRYLEVTAKQNAVPTSDDLLKDCAVMPLLKSTEYALDVADKHIYSIATSECRNDIPGNRYEDFSIDDYHREYSMKIVLVPMFEITYEHNGTVYMCWLGGCGDPTFIAHCKPEDIQITEADAQLGQQIKTQKDLKLQTYLHIAGWGAIGFLGLFIIPSFLQSIFIFIFSGLNVGSFLISVLLGFAPAVVCIPKIKGKLTELNEIKHRIERTTLKKNNYHTDLVMKKQKIAAIVKNKNMSWVAKDEAIKAILSQDSSNT